MKSIVTQRGDPPGASREAADSKVYADANANSANAKGRQPRLATSSSISYSSSSNISAATTSTINRIARHQQKQQQQKDEGKKKEDIFDGDKGKYTPDCSPAYMETVLPEDTIVHSAEDFAESMHKTFAEMKTRFSEHPIAFTKHDKQEQQQQQQDHPQTKPVKASHTNSNHVISNKEKVRFDGKNGNKRINRVNHLLQDRLMDGGYSKSFTRHLKKRQSMIFTGAVLNEKPAIQILPVDEMLNLAKHKLNDTYGIQFNGFNLEFNAPYTQVKLEEMPQAVLISESWNKILAFRSMFAEALAGRWRVLVAADTFRDNHEDRQSDFEGHFWVKNLLSKKKSFVGDKVGIEDEVVRMLEQNADPIATQFGERVGFIDTILVSMIDTAVRSLCPHNQIVQREAYREIKGSQDSDPDIAGSFYHYNECVTFFDYCKLFRSYAILPQHWLLFCEAFLWAMDKHNPYAQEDENEDVLAAPKQSAHAKFVSGMIVLPMIEAFARREFYFMQPVFNDLTVYMNNPGMESQLKHASEEAFTKLFQSVPDIEDHFSDVDREELVFYLTELIIGMIKYPSDITNRSSELGTTCKRISNKWKDLGLAIEALLLLGKEIIAGVSNKLLHNDKLFIQSFAYLWKEAMKVGVLYPIAIHRHFRRQAMNFLEDLASELNWSHGKKVKRIFEVATEISATGTYTHSTEEIEWGARLAWRNSAKCIGRISWNTLQVRDARHIENPNKILAEVVEHMKIATGGTNVQSVMTVFRPQRNDEIFGMRFWSSQIVRYAGYVDGETGKVLGDPANAELTSYLIERELWVPPVERTAFDVLPLVLKLPNNDIPFIYELSNEVISEVDIEHPDFPALKELGCKWTTVPTITNFMMNLGGIKYSCCPFNGWFVSIEVVRNLIERYDLTLPLANVFGIDHGDKHLKERVSLELDAAINYSFEKRNITIVDCVTVGKSFMTHCKNERIAGRECPGQWSWIGGLTGPTNPTWHLEMRDFKKLPQFDYCCKPYEVTNLRGYMSEEKAIGRSEALLLKKRDVHHVTIPKIVIAFGSETGAADSAAHSLAKRLKICEPIVCTLNQVARFTDEYILSIDYFLFICSTFGQGEPPENAKEFFARQLKLSASKFSVLALGSTLYPEYCKAGRDLYNKMLDFGAKAILDISMVDSSKGSQAGIIEWMRKVEQKVLPENLLSEIRSQHLRESGTGPGFSHQDGNGHSDHTDVYAIKWLIDEDIDIHESESCGNLKCLENRELCLFKENEEKNINHTVQSVRHIEFTLENLNYESGDHLSILPLNSKREAIRLCKCFNDELVRAAVKSGYYKATFSEKISQYLSQGSEVFSCPPVILWQMHQIFYIESERNGRRNAFQSTALTNKSLMDVLRCILDFSFHSTTYVIDLLSMLSSKIHDIALGPQMLEDKYPSSLVEIIDRFESYARPLIQKKNVSDVDSFVRKFKTYYPTIVDLFEDFKDLFCCPLMNLTTKPLVALADVLVLMPHIQNRYYSISSSNYLSPNKVSITVGVVRNVLLSKKIKLGLCSNFLADLSKGDMIEGKVVKSKFRKPKSETFPAIMIGAGTGIAPFMAMIEERAAEFNGYLEYADWHFFFGCKTKSEFLYKDKIEEWHKAGIINARVAYSRESNSEKQYVQDLLVENVEDIMKLMFHKNTHVLICGNASMANACRNTMISLLKSHGHMSKISASHLLQTMTLENRWQLDVWGKVEINDGDSSVEDPQSALMFKHSSQRNWILNSKEDEVF